MFWEKYPYLNFEDLNLDWLLKHMRHLIEDWINLRKEFSDLQSAFADLKAYVDTYFDDLDLTAEVSKKIDEMYENGQLKELLESMITVWPSAMHVQPNVRLIHTIKNELFYDEETDSLPYQLGVRPQGACYIPGGTNVVQARASWNSDQVLLTEYSWTEYKVLRSAYLELQHANWITFVPETGKLLIASIGSSVSGNHTCLVYVVDYITFALEQTIDVSALFPDREAWLAAHPSGYIALESVQYDLIDKVYSLDFLTRGDASDGASFGHYVCLWDYANNTNLGEVVLHQQIDEFTVYAQGFMRHNGIYYLLTLYRNAIYAYSGTTGRHLMTCTIDKKGGSGYLLGEPQQISPMSADPVCDFCYHSGDLSNSLSWYTNSFFSRINVFTGLYDKGQTYYRPSATNLYYVNTSSTDNCRQDGSAAYPFRCLDLATLSLQNNPETYGTVQCLGNNPIGVLQCHRVSGSIITNALAVYGFYMVNCSALSVSALVLKSADKVTASISWSYHFNLISVSGMLSINERDENYPIYMNRSNVKFRGSISPYLYVSDTLSHPHINQIDTLKGTFPKYGYITSDIYLKDGNTQLTLPTPPVIDLFMQNSLEVTILFKDTNSTNRSLGIITPLNYITQSSISHVYQSVTYNMKVSIATSYIYIYFNTDIDFTVRIRIV